MGKTVPDTVVMRPAKNGGALRTGNPGNRGGTGRPPDKIKRLAKKALAPRLKIIKGFVDGVSVAIDEHGAPTFAPVEVRDRIAAFRELAKLAADKEVTVEEVGYRLQVQAAVLREILPPPLFAEVSKALSEVWR